MLRLDTRINGKVTPMQGIAISPIVTRTINELDMLEFGIPYARDTKDLVRETQLEDICYVNNDQRFRIKEKNRADNGDVQIVAIQDVDDFIERRITKLEKSHVAITEILPALYEGFGWTLVYHGLLTRERDINITEINLYDLLKQLCEIYNYEFRFDNTLLEIHIYEQMGTNRGAYFVDKLNLLGMTVEEDAYDLYTRVVPIGKDGIGIESINEGKSYVENYSFTNQIKTKVYRNNNVTHADVLLDMANNLLEMYHKPYRSYTLKIVDLYNMKPSEKYDHLNLGLGDAITLLDDKYNTKELHRVIEFKYHVFDVGSNEITLANKKYTLDRIQKSQEAILDSITDNVGDITNPDNLKPNPNPNVLPDKPTMVAEGLFASISLDWTFTKWDFLTYELYGSKTQGFTPDKANLLVEGKVSHFLHEVQPTERWYYRVRAINSHGATTEYSNEISAMAFKIKDGTQYIEDLAIGHALIRDVNADRITVGKLKGQYIQARNLTVENDTGTRTLYIDSNGEVFIDASQLLINSSSVASEDYVIVKTDEAVATSKTHTDAQVKILDQKIELKASKTTVDDLTKLVEAPKYNDFSSTGTLKWWEVENGTANILSGEEAKPYNHTLKITTSINCHIQTKQIQVSPKESYRLGISKYFASTEGKGSFFFGLYAYDAEGRNIGVYVNETDTININPYFYYQQNVVGDTAWRDYEGYVYGCDTPVTANTPKGETGSFNFFKLLPNTATIRLRFLHYRAGIYGDGQSGVMLFANPSVELASGAISTMSERVKQAEIKVQPENIILTVEEAVDSQGKDIFLQRTEFEQTKDDFQFRFENQGKPNEIYNSTFSEGLRGWFTNDANRVVAEVNTGYGGAVPVNNGLRIGECVDATGYARQIFTPKETKAPNFTVSCWVHLEDVVNKGSVGGSAMANLYCQINHKGGSHSYHSIDVRSRLGHNSGWTKFVWTDSTSVTMGDIESFEFYVYKRNTTGIMRVTQIMLTEGAVEIPWSPAGEVYSNTTIIDGKGWTIKHDSGAMSEATHEHMLFTSSNGKKALRLDNGGINFFDPSSSNDMVGFIKASIMSQYGTNGVTLSTYKQGEYIAIGTSDSTDPNNWSSTPMLVFASQEFGNFYHGMNILFNTYLKAPLFCQHNIFMKEGYSIKFNHNLEGRDPGEIWSSYDSLLNLNVFGNDAVKLGVRYGKQLKTGIAIEERAGTPSNVALVTYGNQNFNHYTMYNMNVQYNLPARTRALRTFMTSQPQEVTAPMTLNQDQLRYTCTEPQHITNYEVMVEIPQLISENLQNDYHVCIGKLSFGDYRVKEKTPYYFIVESDKETFSFTYEIIGTKIETPNNNSHISSLPYTTQLDEGRVEPEKEDYSFIDESEIDKPAYWQLYKGK